MDKRSIRIASAAILAFATLALADEPHVRGFDSGAYDLSMTPLERMSEPSSWFLEAGERYRDFEARWELEAAALYPIGGELTAAREELRAWASADGARRLGAWLEDRFLGREAARLKALVSAAVREANALLLYERDDEGRVRLDRVGAPVYRSAGDSDAERGEWRRLVRSSLDEAVAVFRRRVESLRPELLAFAGGDGEGFLGAPCGEGLLGDDYIGDAAASVESRASVELAALASREERLFAARRSADVWSLRRGSEAETASALADELLRSAGETCERGLADLQASLGDAAAGGADRGASPPDAAAVSDESLRSAGADWLECFKAQFDRGLEAWRSAEESLVLRRMAWEREAAGGYREGGEAWAAAFERLAEERRSWEARLSSALAAGELSFERAGSELEARVREAREEFERGALERSVDREGTASAWVDIYRRARSSAEESADRAAYWLSRLGAGAPEARDPGALATLSALTAGEDPERARSIDQARSCLEAYASFLSEAEKARARLASDLEVSLEPSVLDEGEAALLRLEAKAAYWRRRVAVAEAVHAYAVDRSAGRPTEGEGLARLEAAKDAYAAALGAYEGRRGELKAAGVLAGEARSEVEEAAGRLAEAEEALRAANESYGTALSALASGDDGSFLRGELRSRHDELVALYGLSAGDGGNAAARLAAAEMALASEHGTAFAEWRAGLSMEAAVSGEAGEPTLEALDAAVRAVRPDPSPGLDPLDPASYGLEAGDPAATVLSALAAARARLAPASSPGQVREAEKAFELAARAIALGERTRRDFALATRLEGLALIGAPSLDEWYGALAYGDAKTEPGRGFSDVLGRDAEFEVRAGLEARVRLELEALRRMHECDNNISILVSDEASLDEASALAALGIIAGCEAAAGGKAYEEAVGALQAILGVLDNGRAEEARPMALCLQSLASQDGRAAAFLRGLGCFSVGGLDMGGIFAGASASYDARARLAAFERYGDSSPALAEERRLEALGRIDQALSSIGLSRSADGRLASPRDIAAALEAAMKSDPGDASSVLAGFFEGSMEAARAAPDWVAREIAAWREAILGQVAASEASLELNRSSEPDAAHAASRAASERARLASEKALAARAALDRSSSRLAALYGGESRVRVLAEALGEGGWPEAEESLLRRELTESMSDELALELSASVVGKPEGGHEDSLLDLALDLAGERFAFVDGEARARAAESAAERLKVDEALAAMKDPDELSGAALEARLAQAWDGFPASLVIASAREAARLHAVASCAGDFLLSELRRLGASDRTCVSDLRAGGPAGEASWLERYYGSEGETAGAVMETLLDVALLRDSSGGQASAWSVELVAARIDEFAAEPIASLGALRDELRRSMGGASSVAERLLCLALGDALGDVGGSDRDDVEGAARDGDARSIRAIEALGLRGAGGLAKTAGRRDEAGLLSDAYLGLGVDPYAGQAAAHYLASLALSGELEALESAAASRSPAETARAYRIARLQRASRGRAGPYSGDALSWAWEAGSGDPALCLALVRASESGRFDDALAEARGLGVRRGRDDPTMRWLALRLGERRSVEAVHERAAAYELAYAETVAKAYAEIDGSVRSYPHWRLAVRGIAPAGSPDADGATLDSALAPFSIPGEERGPCVDALGALADAEARSALAAHRLEEALRVWSQPGTLGERRLGLAAIARETRIAPLRAIDRSRLPGEPLRLAAEHREARERSLGLASQARALQSELARLGAVLDATLGGSASYAALDRLKGAAIDAESRYEAELVAYKDAGASLSMAGRDYDRRGEAMAQAYDELDAARLALDKEEAIDRWARNPYLLSGAEKGSPREGSSSVWRDPVEELAAAKQAHARAEEALAIVGASLESRRAEGRAPSPTDGRDYEAVAAAYDDECRLLALVAAAREAQRAEAARAEEAESSARRALLETLFGKGGEALASSLSYEDYSAPNDDTAGWKDFLRIGADGRLGLAYGDDFSLTMVDAGMASRLTDYFGGDFPERASDPEGSLSPYERELLGWCARTKGYLADPARQEAWASAREHLVSRLLAANSRYAGLAGSSARADNLKATVGQERILGKSCAEHLDAYVEGSLARDREAAWLALGVAERADLEFFTVMTLTGGARSSRRGLEASALLPEYGHAEGLVLQDAMESLKVAEALKVSASATAAIGVVLSWTPAGPPLLALAQLQFGVMSLAIAESNRLKDLDARFLAPRIAELRANRDASRSAMIAEAEAAIAAGARLEAARSRLATVRGTTSAGACDQAAFEAALAADSRIDPSSVSTLTAAYGTMLAAGAAVPADVARALTALERYCALSVESRLGGVEAAFSAAELSRAGDEASLERAFESFILGEADAGVLHDAAREAFDSGRVSFARHIRVLASGSAAAGFLGDDDDSRAAFASLEGRAGLARSRAELAILEAGWEGERRALADKRDSWIAGLYRSLESGRADYARSEDSLRAGVAAWDSRFRREYGAKAEAWGERMAEFDEARLSWAVDANEAATGVSSGALLASAGADAESAARSFEARGVSSLDVRCGAAEAASEALVLTREAWTRLEATLASANHSNPVPLRSSGRVPIEGAWDSGSAKALAAEFSGRSSERLASMQARLLASATGRAATEAVAELDETLRRANEGFSGSMDSLFNRGDWKREGGAYVKDVVVHATLGRSFITERASVEAYRAFDPGPWSLKADLSEERLSRLDSVSLRGLVAAVHAEVRARGEALFGRDSDRSDAAVAARTRTFYQKKKVKSISYSMVTILRGGGEQVEVPNSYYADIDDVDNPITRVIEPGAFGTYLGYDPVLRDEPGAASSDPFIDPGIGELGRLVGSYLRWALREGLGWAEASKPIYERKLWDDRSWGFEAPTLRGLVDLGVGIVAGSLSGGAALPELLGGASICLADDLAFGALDVLGGYRSLEEAGLSFGVKAGSSALSLLGSGLVGGFGGSGEGFLARGLAGGLAGREGLLAALGRATLDGSVSLLTGVAGSALGALELRYEEGEGGERRLVGLGWSPEAMSKGIEGVLLATAGRMLGSTVSGALDLGLEGFTGSLYEGGRALSKLAGGLSGEALKLALGGEACLSLLDIGCLGLRDSGGSAVEGGLLELRLGKDGARLAVGSGGVDVSLGALAATVGGLEAWGVNAELIAAGLGKDPKLASALRSLRSEGGFASDERNLYERVRIGQTHIMENPDAHYGAITEYDETSGLHTIVLGRKALRDHSRFGLNATLTHEAYRNGVDDGVEAQREESARAVVGHIGVLGSLARAYEESALSHSQLSELAALRESEAGDSARLALVIGAYDTGRDHWKLLADGRLINDNQRRLLMAVTNDDGKGERWQEVEGSSKERSVAAALVRYLGEGRAMELLGSPLDALDNYDDQTLRDVLELDDAEIRGFRANVGDAARLIASLGPFERQRLLGEALMKRAGIAWNAKSGAWEGEGTGLTLSAEPLPGPAAVRALGDGRYERFAITCGVERRHGAYAAWKDGVRGDLAEGNTRIVFTKWDLDTGESVADLVAPGVWNSVDNSYGQLDRYGRPIGTHHPYWSPTGAVLQADTLAAGDFSMRWAFDGSPSLTGQDILIIANARTIAGASIGADGRRPGHPFEDRWLFHDTDYGSSDGCIVHRAGNGADDEYERLFAYLKAWGLVQGYSIPTDLVDLGAGELGLGRRKGSIR